MNIPKEEFRNIAARLKGIPKLTIAQWLIKIERLKMAKTRERYRMVYDEENNLVFETKR